MAFCSHPNFLSVEGGRLCIVKVAVSFNIGWHLSSNSRRFFMKKILAVMLVFGMATAVVFAEINVTGYTQGIITPFFMVGEDTGVANGPGWTGLGPQIQLNAQGANPTKRAGYMLSIVASLPREPGQSPLNPGQENYVWLKPFGDFLTFKVGGYNDYTLHGGSYFSALFEAANFNNPGSWQFVNESTIFSGFAARIDGGFATRNPAALLTFTLIPNLYVGGSFHLNTSGFYAVDPEKSAADYYIDGQYAIGYTIDGIGQIKAQYIGMDTGRGIASYSNTTRLIQAAFKLTMLPNGPIEIGATIPVFYGKADYDNDSSTSDTDAPDGYKEPITIAFGTNLAFGKFGLKANFSGGFGGASGENENTGVLFIAGVEPRYMPTDTITVAIPVGMTIKNATDNNGTNMKDGASFLDVGVSISLDLGASWNINTGVVYAKQLIRGDSAAEQKARFAIPIYFSGALF
jgi:hypothetical protein